MEKKRQKDCEKKKEAKNDMVTISKSEYELLKERSGEKDSLYDKYLRLHAEFENARKRFNKEREAFLKYANEALIMEFLPIVDNMEMAEKHIKDAKDFSAVSRGVDMIHGQIQKFLKELGVEKLKSTGEKFDPNLHEVIEILESDNEDEIVAEELKPGYRLSGKLLRPASVKVTKRKDKKTE